MITLIISLTIGLAVTWAIAFVERVDAFTRSKREPSLWSLLLVGVMVLVHLVLLYAEGYVI